ncbi:hypothetical protein POM88_020366 [Heracleum sosnowskyi]|uniref:Protein kinase domain-containing protein n=1 Tax=Heracleum sosnowskyi TaxID=360622 RepID=A0AAD8ICR2_9APIA|nr:hypothetical protein POM88_020366 [Heracleum sosnowskyi]
MVVFQRDSIFQDYVEHASQVVLKKLAEEVTNDDDKLWILVSYFNLLYELALLQEIRHPNVVQFLGAVTQSSPMMIVTEYLPKGNLCAYMKEGGQLKPLKAVRFALDIARTPQHVPFSSSSLIDGF